MLPTKHSTNQRRNEHLRRTPVLICPAPVQRQVPALPVMFYIRLPRLRFLACVSAAHLLNPNPNPNRPFPSSSEYTPTRHHNIGDDEPPSTPEADQTQGQGGKRKQPAAERSNRSLPPPETPPGSKKKKRKSSSSAGPEGVGGGEGERELGEDASSAAKKSKKKRKAER